MSEIKGYTRERVTSADGTVIGYRRYGTGPGVLILHGATQASQDFTRLAELLAMSHTVFVVDRRGRGMSGPHGPEYCLKKEGEDVTAVLEATGATDIFGLSSGAIVALETARMNASVKRIALYEPPLSINGSSPVDWIEQFNAEVAKGQLARAFTTMIEGVRMSPVPRFLMVPVAAMMLKYAPVLDGDVPIRELIPSMKFDVGLVKETADRLGEFRDIQALALLLEGDRSPGFLSVALDELEKVLPRHERHVFRGLDHLGPGNQGTPGKIAPELLRFFR